MRGAAIAAVGLPLVAPREDLRQRLSAPAINLTQDLYVSAPLPQTARIMAKDEDLCVHCGLCAERCPTAAWDMQKSIIEIPHAVDVGRFGVRREGDVAELRRKLEARGKVFEMLDAIMLRGVRCSSSAIREALADARLEIALPFRRLLVRSVTSAPSDL